MASSDYDVFAVVDDNAAELPASKIQYIKIDDDVCRALGFENLNPMISKFKASRCSAWEKAIYYFSQVETRHEYVWFIEDDVLVTSSSAIQKLDRRYGPADIISSEAAVNRSGDRRADWFWWRCVPNVMPRPWGKSMVCAIRVSRALLGVVGSFVQSTRGALAAENAPGLAVVRLAEKLKNRAMYGQFKLYPRFLFIEYLFHTLALHNGHTILVAPELAGLHWDTRWGRGRHAAGSPVPPGERQSAASRFPRTSPRSGDPRELVRRDVLIHPEQVRRVPPLLDRGKTRELGRAV